MLPSPKRSFLPTELPEVPSYTSGYVLLHRSGPFRRTVSTTVSPSVCLWTSQACTCLIPSPPDDPSLALTRPSTSPTMTHKFDSSNSTNVALFPSSGQVRAHTSSRRVNTSDTSHSSLRRIDVPPFHVDDPSPEYVL